MARGVIPVVPQVMPEGCGWVDLAVLRAKSLGDDEFVSHLTEHHNQCLGSVEGNKYQVVALGPDDRVCYVDPDSNDHIFVYEATFTKVGIQLPFTEFEIAVLKQYGIAPSQIHPNSWGFIRGFEVIYKQQWLSFRVNKNIKVFEMLEESVRDFKTLFFKVVPHSGTAPFWVNKVGKSRFPLSWNEGVMSGKSSVYDKFKAHLLNKSKKPRQSAPTSSAILDSGSTKNVSATPSPSIQSAQEVDNSNKDPPLSRKRKALEPKYGHINSKEFDHLGFAQEYLLGGNSRIPMDGDNFLKNLEAVTRSSIKAAAICHAAHNKMNGCVIVPEGEVEKLRNRVKVVEAEKRVIEGERSELSTKVTRLEAQLALETQDLKDAREFLKKVEKEKLELDEKCRRLYAEYRLKVEDQNDAMILAEEVTENLRGQLRVLMPEFDVNQIGPDHKVVDGVVVPSAPPVDVEEHTAVDDVGDQDLPDGNEDEEEEPTPITVVLPEVQPTMSDPPPTPPS
ncbi:hypothetical protein PIB30_019092 [Stylosanthes scabra]|uniref:Transposase (putative) gypsy type domain-containing protein n=1 Tax=Stylosanthes scabra TaxID=79078 RepID=A0ABU6U8G6_9FABA|nr:hypothetical protein [Stylosanthes scabra]